MRNFLLFITFLMTTSAWTTEKPAVQIKKDLLIAYKNLLSESQKMNNFCDQWIKDEAIQWNWKDCKNQFFKTRLAYKKVALFLEYLDHEYVNDYINGAPLLKIERKAPNLVILQPKGFQIMEEKLMEEDDQAFAKLAGFLNDRLIELEKGIQRARLNERMVFEAMRQSLVSLTALGITGFDTPSGENTAAECQMVLETLEKTIAYYNSYLTEEEQVFFDVHFKKGQSFFEVSDFESFDRFHFIKECINPLYEKNWMVQNRLNIETRALTTATRLSINENARSIFDTDFLDYRYYSAYSNSGDSAARVELGKLLFFDPLLSGNNQRACASCHHPDKAFTDGLKTSLAFNKKGHIQRNSPGLINAVYNTRFFWDARATQPEDQVEHVIFNAHEFHSNYDEIVAKIESCEEYVQRFNDAYPELKNGRSALIGRYAIVASLSAYLQTLRSYNSRFDQEIKSDELTKDKRLVNGFNVFTGKGACATCHFIPTFAGNVPPLYKETETEVLGIPHVNNQAMAELDQDQGRYANGRPKENAAHYEFSFKTATIRNIALTAPYMHNGVFETLEQVVDFYNVGGGHGWGIAPENTTLPADSLHLSETEKADLIYFMESLTDTTGFTSLPKELPTSTRADLKNRPIGGAY